MYLGLVEHGALRRVAPRAAAQLAGSWSLCMMPESLKLPKKAWIPAALFS